MIRRPLPSCDIPGPEIYTRYMEDADFSIQPSMADKDDRHIVYCTKHNLIRHRPSVCHQAARVRGIFLLGPGRS